MLGLDPTIRQGAHPFSTPIWTRVGEFIDWLTIKDNAASLVADVRRIRNHPLIPKSIPVYGYIYDVRTGKLDEVPEAMAMGKAM